MKKAKILVACEYSGRVRDAFNNAGHDAISVDLLPTESPGPHHQGDIKEFLTQTNEKFDLMIAHPPCTYLANSGVSWLHRQEGREALMVEGAEFFRFFLEYDEIPHIAVENPVMHKYAVSIIGRKHDATIQPWQFGEDASKRTCLWLKNLPPLQPTDIIKKERYANQTPGGQNKLGPSPDRWKLRSATYQGIADAMATQWGSLL